MCFQSEEEAYKFYNAYAKMKGFSIRWTHKKTRADDSISARYLVCSKDGVKDKHCTHETRKEQAVTRSLARLVFSSISLEREFGIFRKLSLNTTILW